MATVCHKGRLSIFQAHAFVSSLFALVGVEESLTYETHPTCERQKLAAAHQAFACGLACPSGY